jgi:hypothetical protein
LEIVIIDSAARFQFPPIFSIKIGLRFTL